MSPRGLHYLTPPSHTTVGSVPSCFVVAVAVRSLGASLVVALAATAVACSSQTATAPRASSATTAATTTALPTTTSVEPGPPVTTAAPTTTVAPTTTTTTMPPTPPKLPARVDSPVAGDGTWSVAMTLKKQPVVWTTHYHPLPYDQSIIGSAAAIDQRSLQAALYNGPLIPGESGWVNGRRVQSPAVPWLIAAFNGGFQLAHITGGYMAEGRTIQKLRPGQATLAVSNKGKVVLGAYGFGIKDDGSWKGIFQNLYPVVQNGEVSIDSYHVWWGADLGDVRIVPRSGVCTTKNGLLMYVYVAKVDIRPFADAMVNMGCDFGMELDINGTWPQFATYTNFATLLPRDGQLLDQRMRGPNRYLIGSEKSFIAFFDPTRLPPYVVS
jgi:hypothetical protein